MVVIKRQLKSSIFTAVFVQCKYKFAAHVGRDISSQENYKSFNMFGNVQWLQLVYVISTKTVLILSASAA